MSGKFVFARIFALSILVWCCCTFFVARAQNSPIEARQADTSRTGAQPTTVQTVAIRAGRLFDANSGALLPNQVVLIKGERISEVGPADRVKIPADAKVIDLSRATVLPGLIDAHSHLFLTGEFGTRYDEELLKESWQFRTIEAVVNAKLDLEAGFTTMRDLGNHGSMYSDVDVRNAIDRGLIPGPRLQVATRGMSATGGYGLLGYSPEVTVPSGVLIADSPDGARLGVREQIKYGADVIKIFATYRNHITADGKLVGYPTFTLDEIRAIVDEAHRQGVKVACHAYGGESLHNCVDAGVDSIEHGLDMDEASAQKMAEKNIYFVPTFYVYEGELRDLDHKATSGKFSRAEIHERTFHVALEHKVKIAFGTDVGPFPHGTQAIEFEYFVKFGMKPAEALQSGTIGAATLMGWQDRVGSVEPGKFADIVAVAGNPLADITELERTKFVMKGGMVVRNDLK